MSNSNSNSSGIGFSGLLAVVLITLKLGGWGIVATWSWWWVLAPIWLPVVFIFVIAIIMGVIAVRVKNNG